MKCMNDLFIFELGKVFCSEEAQDKYIGSISSRQCRSSRNFILKLILELFHRENQSLYFSDIEPNKISCTQSKMIIRWWGNNWVYFYDCNSSKLFVFDLILRHLNQLGQHFFDRRLLKKFLDFIDTRYAIWDR